MLEILNNLGALGTVGMGMLGLFAPKRAASFVGLKPLTPAGHAEFRATYGGLWIALGALPLLTQEPASFAIAALCWWGAAIGRMVSIILDRGRDIKNIGAVLFEGIFGLVMIVGAPMAWLGANLTAL